LLVLLGGGRFTMGGGRLPDAVTGAAWPVAAALDTSVPEVVVLAESTMTILMDALPMLGLPVGLPLLVATGAAAAPFPVRVAAPARQRSRCCQHWPEGRLLSD
jgi:hypothetical protein